MRRAAGIAALALAALGVAPAASAQEHGGLAFSPQSQPAVEPMVVDALGDPAGNAILPVLTLDQEALYLNSKWGQRVQADLERQGREIAAENDRLEKQFSDEERELTQLRATLPPDEFRKRADAFDTRVVEVRRERANAARELQARANEERNAFFRAALPVLAAVMRERGAVAVLDRHSVFVAADSIDVTEALIQRLDAVVGVGPGPSAPPSAAQGAVQGTVQGTVPEALPAPSHAPEAAPETAPESAPESTPESAPETVPEPAPAAEPQGGN